MLWKLNFTKKRWRRYRTWQLCQHICSQSWNRGSNGYTDPAVSDHEPMFLVSTLLDLQLKHFLHPTQTNSAKTELLCLLKDANEESSHSLSVSSPSHESDKRPNKCFCHLSKLSYRHRLLISTRSGKNPVMIGPIMIHYRKTFHTFPSPPLLLVFITSW